MTLTGGQIRRPFRLQRYLFCGLKFPMQRGRQILIARSHKGDAQEALKILDNLYEMADRTFNTRFMIEVLALRAMAMESLGKERKAEAELKQALDLAQPGGFIRVFVDLGSQLQAMLKTTCQTQSQQ